MKNLFTLALISLIIVCTHSFAEGNGMILKTGTIAPDFTIPSSNGDTVKLSDFKGKNGIVLIFYPGDETPGCTKQLCALRDDYSAFESKSIKVFGINPGSADSHQKFIKNHNFQFPLLIDEKQNIAKLYGCNGALMVQRTVYAIDKQGVIVFAQRGTPSTSDILKAIPVETP
jgi:peroxiredoxin Q/BCP